MDKVTRSERSCALVTWPWHGVSSLWATWVRVVGTGLERQAGAITRRVLEDMSRSLRDVLIRIVMWSGCCYRWAGLNQAHLQLQLPWLGLFTAVFREPPNQGCFLSITDVSLFSVTASTSTKHLGAWHEPGILRVIGLHSPLIWFCWHHRLLRLERTLEEGEEEETNIQWPFPMCR